MTETNTARPAVTQVDAPSTQTIYVDKALFGKFSAQVSRITFGVENHNGEIIQNICIAMPTASAISLVINTISFLKDEKLLIEIKNQFALIEKQIEALKIKTE